MTGTPSPDPKRKKALHRERQQELQRAAELARHRQQRARRMRTLGIRSAGTLAVIAVLVAAFAYALRGSAAGVDAHAASTALGPTTSDLTSPVQGQFHRVGTPLYQNGKVEVLFIGAQYCPHCAAQRWAIVKALNQFGTFAHVRRSASDDGSIPTYDLTNASYTSNYVSFDHKDLEDRTHPQLQQLDDSENALFNRYDATGGIPLVAVGGYALIGDGYDLSLISGQSFQAIQRGLQRGTASWSPAINAEANAITGFICHANGGKPARACMRSAIRKVVSTIR